MSELTRPLRAVNRPPLPAHEGGLGARILAATATPGGAVFVLCIVLVIAIAARNENFSDPGVLIRFIGRTAPIAIAAMGQYFVIVSGEFDLSMAAVVTAQVVMAGNLIGQDSGRILPVMVLMVAVGAMARQLLLRMPWRLMAARTGAQSRLALLSTSTPSPRSFSSNAMVSMGSSPRSHLDPG